MIKAPKDIGASVRARLLGLARARGDDFQVLLTRYANERLLYRLAASYGSHFVLKGAALFTIWTGGPHRATRDIDLLGYGEPSETHVRDVFEQIIKLDVVDDGVVFDAESLDVGPIREDQEYGGVRVMLHARVASARVRLQVDIGFGDAITPEAADVEFPTLLDFPASAMVGIREKSQRRRCRRPGRGDRRGLHLCCAPPRHGYRRQSVARTMARRRPLVRTNAMTVLSCVHPTVIISGEPSRRSGLCWASHVRLPASCCAPSGRMSLWTKRMHRPS